jgi:hypothetical protein
LLSIVDLIVVASSGLGFRTNARLAFSQGKRLRFGCCERSQRGDNRELSFDIKNGILFF